MPVTVAVIPARGGSKGVPGKNLAEVGGVPLIGRSIRAALGAERIDAVVVSSDDPEILACAVEYGAIAVQRAEEISGDTASSESAILAALENTEVQSLDADIVVMIQCTSPFTSSADLDVLVSRLDDASFAAALTVTEDHVFLWSEDANGNGRGINHDESRPRSRRQDLPAQYRETGQAYAMRVEPFRKHGSRYCGPVALAVTSHPPVEIDTPQDLAVARAIATTSVAEDCNTDLATVRALVTDFDGVHTDDAVWVSEDGSESVRCSRSDGMGIERLRANGVPVLILSKEKNRVVSRRAEKLKVSVIQGEDEKLPVLRNWADEQGIPLEEICYVGNDINDAEAMRAVGIAIAPSDARPEALAVADLVLSSAGGNGAVRELCERLMASRQERDS